MVTKFTWADIERQYPNKWAFIKNVKRNENNDIVSFELLKICDKSEKAKWFALYMKEDYKFECIRTTWNAPNMGALL